MSNLFKEIYEKRKLSLGILIFLIFIIIIYNYSWSVYYNKTLPGKKEKIKQLDGSNDDVETIYKKYLAIYNQKKSNFDSVHRVCSTSCSLRRGCRTYCYIRDQHLFLNELNEQEKIVYEIENQSGNRFAMNLFLGIWTFCQGIYVLNPEALFWIFIIFT